MRSGSRLKAKPGYINDQQRLAGESQAATLVRQAGASLFKRKRKRLRALSVRSASVFFQLKDANYLLVKVLSRTLTLS